MTPPAGQPRRAPAGIRRPRAPRARTPSAPARSTPAPSTPAPSTSAPSASASSASASSTSTRSAPTPSAAPSSSALSPSTKAARAAAAAASGGSTPAPAPASAPTTAARGTRGRAARAARAAKEPGLDLRAPLRYIQDATLRSIDVPPRQLERFLKALEPAKRVFLYGRGRSGFVARAFAVRLMHLGYATYVVGETITAPVQKDDVVVLVSGSGTTYPVVMTAEIGRKLGATVVAVTADPESHIARLAHIVLPIIPPPGNGTRGQYAPLGTLFETASWLFFDAVVALLMQRLGEDEDRMRRRHATLE